MRCMVVCACFNIFYLTFRSELYSIYSMRPVSYFLNIDNPTQRQYETLRAFYIDRESANAAAEKFNFSPIYFKKLRFLFTQQLKSGNNPFFQKKKSGPKKPFTKDKVIEQIISLRKQNHSVPDIKTILDSKSLNISLDTIDKILKKDGFLPLPRRTRQEKLSVKLPEKIKAPMCAKLVISNQKFSTEKGAGPLIFLPVIEKLGIIEAIKKSGFPQTSVLNDISSILSILALKLIGNERLSHDETWNLDRALGLFSGLNVLPKSAAISSYSYRITRSMNRKFLLELSKIFKADEAEEGEFNLDFKAIPHWGDASILEKNWSGARSKSIKSILSLIVNEPATGFLSYTNAEIKHKDQDDAAFEFIDFWKEGRGICPKILIFDSKFTSYHSLNKLNQSKEKIKFLTLRRRGNNLIKQVDEIPEEEWREIYFEERKHKRVRVYDGCCKLRNYDGEVRQVIITNHGRKKPTFLITNDFNLSLKSLIKKYARRWLVEQEIAEQIAFFHLNQPSSSIVIKVDFDLTMSLLAHNLYKKLSSGLPGFEKCTVSSIYRRFIENGAHIIIEDNTISVLLKKKTHLPILFELPWMQEETRLSWLDASIRFQTASTS